MGKAMETLEKLMARTDKVVLKAPGTDLSFSIKGVGAKACKGDRNIPDGEVFSCPLKYSVNGVIQYNTPSVYAGTRFENVRLVLKNGKIVEATANQTERINQIFDTDPGARYIGEFSLGLNPRILNPMNDILFDEKIAGSLHFTPGQAYEDCGNGNKSAIHWDMVLIHGPNGAVERSGLMENSSARMAFCSQEPSETQPGSTRILIMAQHLVTLDLEGVLVPEVWIAFAEKTGIEALKKTTRDIPDYDELMTGRLEVLRENGLTLSMIQEVIATLATSSRGSRISRPAQREGSSDHSLGYL